MINIMNTLSFRILLKTEFPQQSFLRFVEFFGTIYLFDVKHFLHEVQMFQFK